MIGIKMGKRYEVIGVFGEPPSGYINILVGLYSGLELTSEDTEEIKRIKLDGHGDEYRLSGVAKNSDPDPESDERIVTYERVV